MTGEQIKEYEYCKKHLEDIELYIKELPFTFQKHIFDPQAPSIEDTLNAIHKNMYYNVIGAINQAKKEIQSKIDNMTVTYKEEEGKLLGASPNSVTIEIQFQKNNIKWKTELLKAIMEL